MAYQPMTTEEHIEIERRQREDALERARARAPHPSPPPEPPPGMIDPRFPPQQFVTLHAPPPRTRGGDPIEIDPRSEAEIAMDPKNMLARINTLEQRLARIEGMLQQYFGGAGNAGGEVYR